MLTVLIVIGILIVLAVLLISVLTTSKAYSFKHTVDPSPENKTDEDNNQSSFSDKDGSK